MKYGCAVCMGPLLPDDDGMIRQEGITTQDGRQWVWGPVYVHESCRLELRTPYDDLLGPSGYLAAWERVPA